jgi:hypothetical protein
MERRNGILVAAVVAGVAIWFAARWWSRPPVVEFDNLRYVQLLSTALSARNPAWLEKVDLAVTQRHAAGEMSDAERNHFASLIREARTGAWESADRRCFEFAEAQLSRRRSRPPSSGHDHDHGHD